LQRVHASALAEVRNRFHAARRDRATTHAMMAIIGRQTLERGLARDGGGEKTQSAGHGAASMKTAERNWSLPGVCDC
jgi:hypothetical protein